jgi:hypothetical protein
MRHSRRLLVFAATVLVAGLAVTSALGSSVHFKKGGTPSCTISGAGTSSTSTTCTGSVAGLGGEDVTIDVTVGGFAVYQCQNGGGNTAPGQNRVLEGPTTTPTTIGKDEIKNGNLTFTTNSAALSAENTVSGAAAGCPNPNWTGVNPTLTVTDVTLKFYQGGSLIFTCSASNPKGLPSTFTFTNCTFS